MVDNARASYHNHTVWSDGEATVAQMVAAAEDAGLAGDTGCTATARFLQRAKSVKPQ